MTWLMPLALVGGAVLPVQVALNALLRERVGSPLVAALISFLVGTTALVVAVLVTARPLPGVAELGATSWWMWLGGLCGALYVAGSIVLLPRLGAATTIALALAGQLIGSLVLDHFGWLDVPVRHLSMGRVLGVVVLITGVVLIQRS